MLLNERTALVTQHILLVPYSRHHVPLYHEWMQDEDLQALTASEPLSLEEEYQMQQSWRKDSDKLTFIACLTPPIPSSLSSHAVKAQQEDSNDRMIGDINLFLVDDEDDDDNNKDSTEATASKTGEGSEKHAIGEIELMIARPSHRKQGHGRAALLAFLSYILIHATPILTEYSNGKGDTSTPVLLKYLRVKIGEDNQPSIRLFESVGFVRTAEGANYFGEIELRMLDLQEKSGKEVALEGLRKVRGWEDVGVVEYQGL